MTFLRRVLPLVLTTLSLPACIIELDGDLAETIDSHVDARCLGHDGHSELISIDEPIHEVVVDGGIGDVTVRSHDEAGVRGEVDLFADHGRAEPLFRVEGGVLYVSVDCSGRGCCGADLALTIPTEARLEVGLGVGDVELHDLGGAVDIDVGTGDIELDRLGSTLRLHTGTGSIEGQDLRAADVTADVGTGDVELDFDADAPLDALRIDVGMGSVDLRVPSGGYALHLDRGLGDLDVSGLEDRNDSSRRIDIDVGTGDIELRGH